MGDILVVYSLMDSTSVALAGILRNMLEFKEAGEVNGLKQFVYENVTLLEIKTLHTNAYYLNDYKTDLIMFLSKHSSAKGIPAFTTHATGNWSDKAELGGKPHELSYAAPLEMLQLLKSMKELSTTASGPGVTYEATHHGPLLTIPSLFVELGGNKEVTGIKRYQEVVSKSVSRLISGDADTYFSKIVVGIGSNHYPGKFSSIAFGRGYAFAHIMPRYYTSEYAMLEQAFTRSKQRPELAVIDWKSIRAGDRDKIINKLNEIGIDYEKV